MGGGDTSGLTVGAEPELLAPTSLPGHRILTFTLLNEGSDDVVVGAGELSLAGADGSPVRATFTFERDERRPGAAVEAKRAALAPRGEVGVVAVWRDEEAVRLDYPGGTAPLVASATSAPRA
ncbi:MAG: hypothetical protein M3P50_10515 [Actinomycetota bacterium]|nr:hypothetical protein [Actinomycetota bacterium]